MEPVRAEMTWLVSIWDLKSDSDRPAALERYSIHPHAAVMELNGEARTFDSTEAKHVRMLIDMIGTYSVQSTVWWDHGSNAEPDGQVVPLLKDKDGETKGKGDCKQDPNRPPKPVPAVLRGPIALEAPLKPAEVAASSH